MSRMSQVALYAYEERRRLGRELDEAEEHRIMELYYLHPDSPMNRRDRDSGDEHEEKPQKPQQQ